MPPQLHQLLRFTTRLLAKSAAHLDIVLTVFLLVALLVMILPVPVLVLDCFLALNLTFAISLFVLALYTPGVRAFSTFPSLLLFATLFRLALNIATTRSILSSGNAGQIVDTFGSFVMGGNMVIGAVIFLIILIVQLMVIGKGAERVAEVAARFTLDAMPGKQISIDAQLKSGAIDQVKAQELRSALEEENQVYASMDGAMKFVKGDAMAGVMITAINLLAGFAVGVWQQGYSPAEAAVKFSTLTVGDGLISQIPALLIALTSGIVVTKVNSSKQLLLGREIATQYADCPPSLIYGGAIALFIGFIPGFPTVIFVLLASSAIGTGLAVKANPDFLRKLFGKNTEEPPLSELEQRLNLSIQIGLGERLNQRIDQQKLASLAHDLVDRLSNQYGIPIPTPVVQVENYVEQEEAWVILFEAPMSTHEIPLNAFWVPLEKSQLDSLKITVVHSDRETGCWVPNELKQKVQLFESRVFDVEEMLCQQLECALEHHLAKFLGLPEIQSILDTSRKSLSTLVAEVERHLTPQSMREVLCRLLDEGVPLRAVRLWLQCLSDRGPKVKEPLAMLVHLRNELRHVICQSVCDPHRRVHAYVIDHTTEQALRAAQKPSPTGRGNILAMEPQKLQKLKELAESLVSRNRTNLPPIIVTAPDIRRTLWALLGRSNRRLRVLSYAEIDQPFHLQCLGNIGLDETDLKPATKKG